MKQIFLFLILLSFIGCDNEDDLKYTDNSFYSTFRYDSITKADPNDEVQTYIHEFYQKTGVVIIKNPQIADYRYNFNDSGNLLLTAPEQNNELLMKGIKLLEDVFINYYLYPASDKTTKDYSFIKKYFPFTLQLADTIQKTYISGYVGTFDDIITRKLVAVGRINTEIDNLSDIDIQNLRKDINSTFWQNQMINYTQYFTVPKNFYNYSSEYYGKNYYEDLFVDHKDWIYYDYYYYDAGINYDNIDDFKNFYYERGFLNPNYYVVYDYYFSYTDPIFISRDADIKDFIKGLFSYTKAEFELIEVNNLKIEGKYNALRDAILEQFNFDIANFFIKE